MWCCVLQLPIFQTPVIECIRLRFDYISTHIDVDVLNAIIVFLINSQSHCALHCMCLLATSTLSLFFSFLLSLSLFTFLDFFASNPLRVGWFCFCYIYLYFYLKRWGVTYTSAVVELLASTQFNPYSLIKE